MNKFNLRLLKKIKLVMILLPTLFISISCLGQYHGRITDGNSNPIPYAHIQLIGTNLGTITNLNGEFKLNIPKDGQNKKILITCIGYLPKEAELTDDINLSIKIREDIKILNEVVVIPREYAREIVKKAINNIPKNYPLTEEYHKGFLREYAYWGDTSGYDKTAIYVAEAVLGSEKKSYHKKTLRGAVELIEERKYESEVIDSLATRFYAGPHHTHRFDFVARRSAFLSRPDDFEYVLIDTVRLERQNVFKISFRGYGDDPFGTVYVMDSTFALIKGDFNYQKFSPLNITDRGREHKSFSCSYYKGLANYWRLKHTNYKTTFKKNGQKFSINSEYITTSTEPNNIPINYQDKIQFGEIFLNKVQNYDPDFWSNYTILLPDQRIDKLVTSYDNNKKDLTQNNNESINRILNSLTLSYELSTFLISSNGFSILFPHATIPINLENDKENFTSTGLSSAIYYDIVSGLKIGLSSTLTFSKNKVTNLAVELLKDINLNPTGRPYFVSPKFALGEQRISHFLSEVKVSEPFQVGDQKFDSGVADIYLEQRHIFFRPSLQFGVEKSHRFRFIMSCAYNINLSDKTGLYIDEKDQFFLKQKNVFLENGESDLEITNNRISNDFQFSIGFQLKLLSR